MIRDLDDTIAELLKSRAIPLSELAKAEITFDLPAARWREEIYKFTVNCYLYDLREDPELRNLEPWLQRNEAEDKAARRLPPIAIDCAYSITAWAQEVRDQSIYHEHRLLSQALAVLVRYRELPADVLKGSLKEMWNKRIHFRTAVARPDGIKNEPEFWGALDQPLKPSLNYVVTLPYMVDEEPQEMISIIKDEDDYTVKTDYCEPKALRRPGDSAVRKCDKPNDV